MSPATSSGGSGAGVRVGQRVPPTHRPPARSPARPASRRRPAPRWVGQARGSEAAALASALVLSVAAAEIALVGRLQLFFDLCFVLICLHAAIQVRPRDFFTVGVLPPLLMLGTMVIVALNGPRVIARPHDGVVQAVVSGLAHHSVALLTGYAVCLLALLGRQRRAR